MTTTSSEVPTTSPSSTTTIAPCRLPPCAGAVSNGPPVTGSYMNAYSSNLLLTISSGTLLGSNVMIVNVAFQNSDGSLTPVGQEMEGTGAGGILTLSGTTGGSISATYTTGPPSISFNTSQCQAWATWTDGGPPECSFQFLHG